MKREKHTMRWLRSILSVMIVSLLLSSLVGFYALKKLERSVLDSNADMISYAQRSIDSKLQQLYYYSSIIGITRDNIALKNLDHPVTETPSEAYALSENMKNYLISNPLVKGVFLYYPKADLIVGDLGCYSPASYYALMEFPDRSGYLNWMDSLLSRDRTCFALISTSQSSRLCYIQQTIASGELAAVMVIEVNQEELLQEFSTSNLHQSSALAVLVDGSPAVYTGSPQLLEVLPQLYQRRDPLDNAGVSYHGKIGFFRASDLSELEYARICHTGKALGPVWAAVGVCLMGAVGCLIFDIAASLFVSQKNARPMKNLLRQLGADETSPQDEYQFITEKFHQMTREQQKNQALAQRHQILLNGMFLSSVLRGNLYSENAVFSMAKRCEITFEYPCYQVLVMSGCGQLRSSSGLSEQEQVSELLESWGFESLTALLDGRYVILLNTEDSLPREETARISALLMKQLFPNQPAHGGVGSSCDSMVDILTSYNCALQALKQHKAEICHPLTHYTPELASSESGDPAVMQAFAQYIYDKEYIQAEKLLGRLFSEYLQTCNSSGIELIRRNAIDCLLCDALQQTLSPALAEQEVQALTASTPPEHRRQQIGRALQALIHASTVDKKEKLPVAARAKQMIDDRFTDPMIGLYMISEQLGISNSYLSTTFKNAYGITVISYINQLRVEKAKQLILNTDQSIKEIALAVGFSSDINFIRVFKKLENLTPATLRKEQSG